MRGASNGRTVDRLDGTLGDGKLTILLRLTIRPKAGGQRIIHISLWEPGITNVDLNAGSNIDGMRPIISVDVEKGWSFQPIRSSCRYPAGFHPSYQTSRDDDDDAHPGAAKNLRWVV